MTSVGSVAREAAAEWLPFLAEKYPGRRRAIEEFTHRDSDCVFWIYPDVRLFDARDSHLRNVPRGYYHFLDDEQHYGGFLRGRVATHFCHQLVVVYCGSEALSSAGPAVAQLLLGIARIPMRVEGDALVISDNGDIHGTVVDLSHRTTD